MKFFVVACLLPLALAFDFTVGVGKDETTGKKGLGFDPSVITPAIGDTIVFEFRSGAHSVVQSTFDSPCTPSSGGFNTGVQTVPDNLEVDAPGLPQIRLAVNSTDPLWFYDEAGGLCNKGAVLAVNPATSGTQTAAQFKENSLKAPATSASASPSSAGSGSGSSSSSASATASSPANTGFRDGMSSVAVIFGLVIGLL
ncbi:hypothetical protein HGRIS_006975 [Hohenbuehelia grisea]|uniref:Uncharacterized protein n=1 Tax=Hohenbuehelia grisea TaxID=104357 RepID=A0ABR3JAN2_9AGAR